MSSAAFFVMVAGFGLVVYWFVSNANRPNAGSHGLLSVREDKDPESSAMPVTEREKPFKYKRKRF